MVSLLKRRPEPTILRLVVLFPIPTLPKSQHLNSTKGHYKKYMQLYLCPSGILHLSLYNFKVQHIPTTVCTFVTL